MQTYGVILAAVILLVGLPEGKEFDQTPPQSGRPVFQSLHHVATAGGDTTPNPFDSLSQKRKGTDTTEAITGPGEVSFEYAAADPSSARIRFLLPYHAHVCLTIFDLRGREVRKVVDCDKEAGSYTVTWNGRDSEGKAMPDGVYFYRMETEKVRSVKKIDPEK
jgi:hypothetical protein